MSIHDINELQISAKAHGRVTVAIEDIAGEVGDEVAVCIILIDVKNPARHFARTDGPPELLREMMGLPGLDGLSDDDLPTAEDVRGILKDD